MQKKKVTKQKTWTLGQWLLKSVEMGTQLFLCKLTIDTDITTL